MGRKEAVMAVHFPDEPEEVRKAMNRFEFEEMFNVQKDALLLKKEWAGEKQERLKVPMNVDLIKDFFMSLKFTPTDSQKIAIYEILKDMENDRAMSRLLEGDVGSAHCHVGRGYGQAGSLHHRVVRSHGPGHRGDGSPAGSEIRHQGRRRTHGRS